MHIRESVLAHAKKIVVKVGSSVITKDAGTLDREVLASLALEIRTLMSEGRHVVIVSSGAIASGMKVAGFSKRPKKISTLQAIAAIGQNKLMKSYEEAFMNYGINVAQLLLTREDFSSRTRYLNARATLLELLQYKVVPIVNENDTVSIDEIKFGDNDTLSSYVANLIDADLLVILSDVEGFYDSHKDRTCVLRVVADINAELRSKAQGTRKEVSVGGMVSKLDAAKIAISSGIPMVLAHGRQKGVLTDIVHGKETGTLFLPKAKLSARFRWVAYAGKSKGKIFVDQGAQVALCAGKKSLLSSGIIKVSGEFEKGDVVSVADVHGCDFARGLTNYASSEVNKIKGLNSERLREQLRRDTKPEVIHRDNIVLLSA